MRITQLLTGMLAAALLVNNVPAEDFVSGVVEEAFPIDQVVEEASEAVFEGDIFETDIGEINEAELDDSAFSSDVDTAFDDGEDTVIEEAADITIERAVEAVSTAIVDSGTCGENLTWTLDSEGTLTISGTGEMEDYYYDTPENEQINETDSPAPWSDYVKNIRRIIIGNGVLNIGDYSFVLCPDIEEVSISDSVETIGDYAFYYSGNYGDDKYLKVYLPDSVHRIGDWAFYRWSLGSILIPENVTEIGEEAVWGPMIYCIAGSYTESWVNGTGHNFRIRYISSAISWERSSDGVLIVSGSGAMNDYGGGEESPRFGDPVPLSPWNGDESIEKVIIQDGVTVIGDFAFYGMPKLKEIIIPNSVINIGECAFGNCPLLGNVKLPNSVKGIKQYTYYYENGNVNCTPFYMSPNAVIQCEYMSYAHYFLSIHNIPFVLIDAEDNLLDSGGCGALNEKDNPYTNFREEDPVFWKYYSDGTLHIEGSGNMSAGNRWYMRWPWEKYVEDIKKIIINEGVLSISEGAFEGCRIKNITIPSSVGYIDRTAFDKCELLEDVQLTRGLKVIGQAAFWHCTSLIGVRIPETVESIEMRAFSGCTSLKSVIFDSENGNIKLSRLIFEGCNNLTIYGYSNTPVEIYAKENNIPFVAIDGSSTTIQLDRPETLKTTPVATGLKLTWSAVPNAKKYRVFRDGVLIKTIANTVYLDRKVESGAVHSYYIRAVGYKADNTSYKTSKRSKIATTAWIAVPEALSVVCNRATRAVVSWKKDTSVKGYQVRYSLQKNMNDAQTVTIRKNTTRKTAVKGLTSGQTYYFQVRSYKKIDGKNYYSAWSGKESVKVK